MTLYRNTAEQIIRAYKKMSKFYRPMAPSDGFGNITVPVEDLDLDQEALEYAKKWDEEEDKMEFHIGCCDFPTRPATIYAVEAARLLCGAENDTARKLLQLALNELKPKKELPKGRNRLPWRED